MVKRNESPFYPSGTITNAGLARIATEKTPNGWTGFVDGFTVTEGNTLRSDAFHAAIRWLRDREFSTIPRAAWRK